MAAEIIIPWGGYLQLGVLAYDLAAQIFGLPDPLDLFISLFSGRPTLQATADIASLLNKYTSPTIKFLALGAGASLNAGVPLSSSSGDPIFGPFYGAALGAENAIRWGSQNAQATNLDNATLTRALHEGGNPGVAGTQTLDAIQRTWELLAAGNPQPGDAAYIAIIQLSQDAGPDPTSRMLTGFAQESIAAGLIPGQQPTPASPNPQGTPTPTPSGTQAPVQPTIVVTDECCIQLAGIQYQGVEQLSAIKTLIFQLIEQFANGSGIAYQGVEQLAYLNGSAHLSRLELRGIHQQLHRIWKKMPPSTAAEQIVFALECICDAINNQQALTGGSTDLTPVVQAIDALTVQVQRIADASGPITLPPDTFAGKIEQITSYLVSIGGLDSTVAQILTS